MAETSKKPWSEVLASVYDLLLENVDDVVDDTSLQKLLGWLEEICKDDESLQTLLAVKTGTLRFLQHERAFRCSKTLSVALRLCGLLCRKKEGFILLSANQNESTVEKLFGKVAADVAVWSDGDVRDAYFTAMMEFMAHEEGFCWLQHSDCLDVALQCIGDSSMFVAVSARVFLVKYVMKCSHAVHHDAHTIPPCIASLTKSLQQILQSGGISQQAAVTSQRIAVIDVVRMFLEEDAVYGAAFVQRTGLLVACLQQIRTANSSVCDKLVDVLREMMTKRKILNWGKLFQQQGGGADQPVSAVLLELPLTLFARGFISHGLYLTAALGSYQDCPSDCSASWLMILFQLFTSTVNVALACLCKDVFLIQSDTEINSTRSITSVVKDLTNRVECGGVNHGNLNLHQILVPWLQTKSMCSNVVCQAVNASEELLKLGDDEAAPVVTSWVRLVLGILEPCFVSVDQAPGKLSLRLYGNERVLKCCLNCVAKFAEGLSPGQEGHDLTELCKDVLRVMIELTENSETSPTVISRALKITGNILKGACEASMNNIIFHLEDDGLCVPAKRARRDERTTTENGNDRTTPDELQRKLGFVLHRKLRDPSWEVRDSVLGLILVILEIRQAGVAAFVREASLPRAVWAALSDTGESYVRATALQALAGLSCQDQLWSNLLQTCCLTEVDVVVRVAGVLLEEDEAFPRRQAAACLVRWVKAGHTAVRAVLEPERRSNLSPDKYAQNPAPPGIKLTHVVATGICRACQDFDWEVKLLGIQFYEAVVDHFIACGERKAETSEELPDRATFCRTSGRPAVTSPDLAREHCLCALASTGACGVLLQAVNDCDHMVCEAALLLLIRLKGFCFPEETSCEVLAQTAEEIQEYLSSHREISLDEFRHVLEGTDFKAALRASTAADSSVRSDAVSFLEDILSAAADNEHNLLDCY